MRNIHAGELIAMWRTFGDTPVLWTWKTMLKRTRQIWPKEKNK